jgi:hypothetical protein
LLNLPNKLLATPFKNAKNKTILALFNHAKTKINAKINWLARTNFEK